MEKKQNQQKINKEYNELVKKISPKPNIVRNCFRAFWVGGLICVIGQGIFRLYESWGHNIENATNFTAITLIFFGALLTGLDIYSKIGKYAGAGSVIPITGFANAVVSPAIEFKREGYVFGVGAKIFSLAGPVILYGVLTSYVVGFIYFILNKLG
ncbi:stage V sporulation protein AC [Natranaerovirga pectinivora]|uniref:Stage V sporulation protein AC n=1 Tax=Natranaerovirga pectinivora TaxID=682400 RepID=A0A4R3MNM6_9FIRM|nr:stage V sporulation protein AC [Natranaerovirga pectinivora]TCT14289.1 stage V sporulation protein AC [Natranaerovirga pectinivora]